MKLDICSSSAKRLETERIRKCDCFARLKMSSFWSMYVILLMKYFNMSFIHSTKYSNGKEKIQNKFELVYINLVIMLLAKRIKKQSISYIEQKSCKYFQYFRKIILLDTTCKETFVIFLIRI